MFFSTSDGQLCYFAYLLNFSNPGGLLEPLNFFLCDLKVTHAEKEEFTRTKNK